MKILATDVRVNNYASLLKKTPFTLNAIDIQAIVNEGAIYYAIPLTSKHLLNFGFATDDDMNYYHPLPNGNAVELCVEFEMGDTVLIRSWKEDEPGRPKKRD